MITLSRFCAGAPATRGNNKSNIKSCRQGDDVLPGAGNQRQAGTRLVADTASTVRAQNIDLFPENITPYNDNLKVEIVTCV